MRIIWSTNRNSCGMGVWGKTMQGCSYNCVKIMNYLSLCSLWPYPRIWTSTCYSSTIRDRCTFRIRRSSLAASSSYLTCRTRYPRLGRMGTTSIIRWVSWHKNMRIWSLQSYLNVPDLTHIFQDFRFTRVHWKALDNEKQRCDSQRSYKEENNTVTECIVAYLEKEIGCSMGLQGSNPHVGR